MSSPRTSVPVKPSPPIAPLSRLHDDNAVALWSSVESAVARLEEAVEQETASLQAQAGIDLRVFHDRKSQGLLELTRAMRHIEGSSPAPSLLNRLASLRSKLEANSAVLRLHLEAVREVFAVMADAMREAESDGTYARPLPNGPGKMP